jgi:hypothetical protein
MSQAPLIPYTISFELLLKEYAITAGRLRADKNTKALFGVFTQFRPRLIDGLLQELALEEALTIAQEGIYGADTTLNEVSLLVLDIALAHTQGSLTAPLYSHLAGKERPRIFIRPILGNQLTRVRTWIDILKDPSLTEELRALQSTVAEAVFGADAAITTRDKAQEERSRFWKIGQKKQLIDDFNQVRRDLFEKLKALTKELPEDYARSFFAERRTETRQEGEALVNRLRERLAQNEAEAIALRELLVTAEKEVEEQQRAEEEQEAARIALAQEEKAIAEAKKRAQELRAKLGKRA